MENTSGSGTSSHIDPASDLAVLNRAKASVDLDQVLNFGPPWYAAALATMIGGMTLFSEELAGDWSFAYAIVGMTAGMAMLIHDVRRRQVRQRPSIRKFIMTLPIFAIAWGVLAAWGAAVSSIGYERFVPFYGVLAWLLTTSVFLAIRAGLHTVRAGRGSFG